MSGKSQFERLLSPCPIKQVKLRNRMVKTGSAINLASENGFITEAHLGFYETIAKGGVGLVIVPHGFVDYPMGVTGPRRIAINDDKFVPGLSKLSQIIHKHGAACFQQLGHAGPTQRWLLGPNQKPVAASYVEQTGARPLTIPEIKDLVAKWGRAATRAREAGFDGVEVNSSARYLLNSFLSLNLNKRTDEYGSQSMENRARFTLEVIREVRARVGEDFPVGVRMNVVECGMANGSTIEESQVFARMFQDAGVDYINTQVRASGPYELLGYPEQVQYPEPMVPFARTVRRDKYLVSFDAEIKKVVDVPVIAVGRLDAEIGEWVLRNGKADLIGLNRRLFADPEYPNRVASGRLEDIAPCTACMHCWDSQQTGGQVRCRINPTLGREYELALKPAERRKKVMIVGAGPAGMAAARVAALRGHEVVLYEKGHSLGGLMPLAAMIKGTRVEDIPSIVAYFKTQLGKLGVPVRLGTEVNAGLIEKVKPEVVIIAAGGVLTAPPIPGGNNIVSNVALHKSAKRFLRWLPPEVLNRLTRFYLPFGKRVIVIGGLMQGCELAEFLVKRGRKVTIVEASDQLGTGIHDINRNRLLPWLTKKGVVMLTGARYEEVVAKGLIVITKEGQRQTIEADSIVLATPPVANNGLFDSLKGTVKELYLIGDAKEPRTILEAISDGFQIGRTI